MATERWFYDDERNEVIDITIPDGRSAAPSYPVARLLSHAGMRRQQLNSMGKRVANLPEVERQRDNMLDVLKQVHDSGALSCCCGETPCIGSCISTLVDRAIKAAEDPQAAGGTP